MFLTQSTKQTEHAILLFQDLETRQRCPSNYFPKQGSRKKSMINVTKSEIG